MEEVSEGAIVSEPYFAHFQESRFRRGWKELQLSV